MILSILKPKKALNKAYLKVKPHRKNIEDFKNHLISLLDRINEAESEEFHKNLVIDFLNSTYYKPDYFINTKGRNDLVIHNGKTAKTSVGVIIEAKSPTNKAEMITTENLNRKAFQELVLYYLRERITHKNLEIKHLVATNINEWFIFNATTFDRLFAQNKTLVKQFNDFENGRLAGTKTDFFYKEIAAPFIENIKAEIEFTYFNFQNYQKPLRNDSKADDNKLISLFKLLSPEHLLKLPFVNDSNSLDKKFYSELLHIIGLTETKSGSKKLIERSKGKDRNAGSILENTITRLDSLDIVSRLNKPSQFGKNAEERLFNVALELTITWINRVLFLKLMEAQLLKYHNGNSDYAFLNAKKVGSYDDLNSLFFQVLAKPLKDRNDEVKNDFGNVPYLNSSLFETTDIERETVYISSLKDDKKIPIHSQTVLKDQNGKKRKGEISTLHYLFEFLNAYDFSSEGSEEIQEENKTLINASVLGLIFEKINGYKDGSFFTPGFITMYMCRETIRKAVIQKFNETQDWHCKSIADVYDKIEDRNKANEIVNSLKICDPAVGSGHFLVSALNEIIAIKNDLKILQDREGKRLKEYQVEVVNDELVVTDEDGELFEYHPNNKESQRIQETLFHEKQTIIENCLFGVDINSNSVKICRLRLWIELLKNAYYIPKNSSPEKGRWPKVGGVKSANPRYPKTGGVKINNLPYLKTFRKELRNNLTPAEAKLWTLLKGKQLEGRKFRRQHSVGNYILDFYCPKERIAIELDGQGHFEATQAEYDYERDLFLEAFGIRVLRFENKVVWDNPEGLLEEVKSYFGKQLPSGSFSDKGRWSQIGGVDNYKQPPRPSGTREGKEVEPPRPSGTPPLKGVEFKRLQTLPNIDINIKCGNSLISRFDLDSDLKKALKNSKWNIQSYRIAVATYRNAKSKEHKREMEKLIDDIKSDFRSEISMNDPKMKRLYKLKGELFNLTQQHNLFEQTKKEKAAWNKKVKELTAKTQKLETEIETIKNNKIYENAFEWRFEFPEVLNDDGDFVGFDAVIGNPPYGVSIKDKTERKYLVTNLSKVPDYEIYYWFINRGQHILKQDGLITYIIPNTILFNVFAQSYRLSLFDSWNLNEILDCTNFNIFEDATVRNIIFQFAKTDNKKNTLGYKNTFNVESFEQLSQRDRLIISKEIAKNNIRNWGLVFKLNKETLSLIDKIKTSNLLGENYDITQGYIPYRKSDLIKIYGNKKAESIVKNREWHSDNKINEEYKEEIWGKSITKYGYKRTNSFVWYGKHLATYVDPKFFNQKRILIREITNPSIIACLVKEEFVNDPQIIDVIQKKAEYSLEIL